MRKKWPTFTSLQITEDGRKNCTQVNLIIVLNHQMTINDIADNEGIIGMADDVF